MSLDEWLPLICMEFVCSYINLSKLKMSDVLSNDPVRIRALNPTFQMFAGLCKLESFTYGIRQSPGEMGFVKLLRNADTDCFSHLGALESYLWRAEGKPSRPCITHDGYTLPCINHCCIWLHAAEKAWKYKIREVNAVMHLTTDTSMEWGEGVGNQTNISMLKNIIAIISLLLIK